MVREVVFVGTGVAFEGRSAVLDGMVAVLSCRFAAEQVLAYEFTDMIYSTRIPSVRFSVKVRVVVQIVERKIKRKHCKPVRCRDVRQ